MKMKCYDLSDMSTLLPLKRDEMSSRKADEFKVTVWMQDMDSACEAPLIFSSSYGRNGVPWWTGTVQSQWVVASWHGMGHYPGVKYQCHCLPDTGIHLGCTMYWKYKTNGVILLRSVESCVKTLTYNSSAFLEDISFSLRNNAKLMVKNSFSYINTSEIPSELSSENFILYLHTWR